MIYVYAIMPAEAAVPALPGLDDAPVDGRALAGLTLAVSEHDAKPEATDAAVLRHAQVVEGFAQGAPVLPARFGLVFADASALRREVEAKATALRGRLDRVRGCAEVGLRVVSEDERHEAAPLTGGDYLRARLRESTERRRVAEALHEMLAGHARDSTRRDPAGGRILLDAAYLVPVDRVQEFRHEVDELGRSHPELALVCTGPWPPYSFAAPPEGAPR